MSIHNLTVNTIDGEPQSLGEWEGRIVLIVNTASQSEFTPQYDGLEALYQEHKDAGFAVLAFPCNDFGGNEPGLSDEIKSFCREHYSTTFPLFEKIKVKGKVQSPLYKTLADQRGLPESDFHKYLVGRDGTVLRTFPAKVGPDNRGLRAAIEAALRS